MHCKYRLSPNMSVYNLHISPFHQDQSRYEKAEKEAPLRESLSRPKGTPQRLRSISTGLDGPWILVCTERSIIGYYGILGTTYVVEEGLTETMDTPYICPCYAYFSKLNLLALLFLQILVLSAWGGPVKCYEAWNITL